MAVTEREFRSCATDIAKMCNARGFNLKEIGRVCEFVAECVTITEIEVSG